MRNRKNSGASKRELGGRIGVMRDERRAGEKSAERKASEYVYNAEAVRRSLVRDARALGIPAGSAEAFIRLTMEAVDKSLGEKPTEREVNRAVIREIKKYSPDLTYYLQHRDEII